jgi:hypothetical protein
MQGRVGLDTIPDIRTNPKAQQNHSPIFLKPPHAHSIAHLKPRVTRRLTPQLGDQPDALVAEPHGSVAVMLIGAADPAVRERDDRFSWAGGARPR